MTIILYLGNHMARSMELRYTNSVLEKTLVMVRLQTSKGKLRLSSIHHLRIFF